MRIKLFAALGMTILLMLIGKTVASANTAGLVVIHGDGTQVTKVIEFDEGSISGVDLITRSGLTSSVVQTTAGQTVYMIDGEGDPKKSVTKSGKSYLWGLYTFKDGFWELSPVDAGSLMAGDGDVQAWLWQSYGQTVDFPAISIPEMDIQVASGKIKEAGSADPAGVLPTATAKKSRGTMGIGAGWGYALAAAILIVLAIVLADKLRPRYRRRK